MALPVDDPADPRLADFAAVDPRPGAGARSSRRRATAGYLVVEGAFAVRRLIGPAARVRAVLVDATQHAALADVLGGRRRAGLPRHPAR